MSHRPRIVIIGGGFGGVTAYRHLRQLLPVSSAEVTLVSRERDFVFAPMLHEVAAGGLQMSDVTESLERLMRRDDALIIDEARLVDTTHSVITTTSQEIFFDFAVVALGARTQWYDVPGAQQYAYPLKSTHDVEQLKQHLREVLRDAQAYPGQRQRLLRTVIVGGGATGVELATELDELWKTLRRYHGLGETAHEVVLCDSGKKILSQFPDAVSSGVATALRARGIMVRHGARVVEVRPDGVSLSDGTRIDCGTTCWVAGVAPHRIPFRPEVSLDQWGRVVVDPYLQLADAPGVFVVGDMAHVLAADGSPLPMTAQLAVQQGKLAAQNVAAIVKGAALERFVPTDRGVIVSLGQWKAVGMIHQQSIGGALAWWIRRTVYVFRFYRWSRRLAAAIDWTRRSVGRRDIGV
jgi:NADH dehydrogenase